MQGGVGQALRLPNGLVAREVPSKSDEDVVEDSQRSVEHWFSSLVGFPVTLRDKLQNPGGESVWNGEGTVQNILASRGGGGGGGGGGRVTSEEVVRLVGLRGGATEGYGEDGDWQKMVEDVEPREPQESPEKENPVARLRRLGNKERKAFRRALQMQQRGLGPLVSAAQNHHKRTRVAKHLKYSAAAQLVYDYLKPSDISSPAALLGSEDAKEVEDFKLLQVRGVPGFPKLAERIRDVLNKYLPGSRVFVTSTGALIDAGTGLGLSLVYDKKKPKELILAFGGTGVGVGGEADEDGSAFSAQWKANVVQGIGGVPPSTLQAVLAGTTIADLLKETDIDIVCAGHSKGGMEAIVVGLSLGKKVYADNPAPVVGARDLIRSTAVERGVKEGKNILKYSREYVHTISISTDPISHLMGATREEFGVHDHIPMAECWAVDLFSAHRASLQSAVAWLKTKPASTWDVETLKDAQRKSAQEEEEELQADVQGVIQALNVDVPTAVRRQNSLAKVVVSVLNAVPVQSGAMSAVRPVLRFWNWAMGGPFEKQELHSWLWALEREIFELKRLGASLHASAVANLEERLDDVRSQIRSSMSTKERQKFAYYHMKQLAKELEEAQGELNALNTEKDKLNKNIHECQQTLTKKVERDEKAKQELVNIIAELETDDLDTEQRPAIAKIMFKLRGKPKELHARARALEEEIVELKMLGKSLHDHFRAVGGHTNAVKSLEKQLEDVRKEIKSNLSIQERQKHVEDHIKTTIKERERAQVPLDTLKTEMKELNEKILQCQATLTGKVNEDEVAKQALADITAELEAEEALKTWEKISK